MYCVEKMKESMMDSGQSAHPNLHHLKEMLNSLRSSRAQGKHYHAEPEYILTREQCRSRSKKAS